MRIRFFDSFCSVGLWASYPRFRDIPTVDDLLGEMEYYGIERALVTHTAARQYDNRLGNRLLGDAIKNVDRLSCSWVAGPSDADLLERERLTEHRVRSVYIHPSPMTFPLCEWVLEDVLERLNAVRLPVFLHLANIPLDLTTKIGEKFYEHVLPHDWDAVYRIAKRFADIPLVVCRISHLYTTVVERLLAVTENTYVELSNYHDFMALEDAVARFGPERLLFGTNLPFQDPGQSLAALTYADITDEEKQLIAGGNLERLIEECDLA